MKCYLFISSSSISCYPPDQKRKEWSNSILNTFSLVMNIYAMNIRQNNNFPFEYKICIFATLADSALLLLSPSEKNGTKKEKKNQFRIPSYTWIMKSVRSEWFHLSKGNFQKEKWMYKISNSIHPFKYVCTTYKYLLCGKRNKKNLRRWLLIWREKEKR